MSDFSCPKCGKEYSIAELDAYEMYEDGYEAEFECGGCSAEFIVTSVITGWEFEAELNE